MRNFALKLGQRSGCLHLGADESILGKLVSQNSVLEYELPQRNRPQMDSDLSLATSASRAIR